MLKFEVYISSYVLLCYANLKLCVEYSFFNNVWPDFVKTTWFFFYNIMNLHYVVVLVCTIFWQTFDFINFLVVP